jgi:predicted ATPase
MALAESSGECWWMAELQRVRAEELWRSGAIQDAEMGGQQAVATARAQGAKSLELRATISLARLRQSQGKHHETRNTLSDIYHWFTEGFGAKDLQEAKALIEELS